MIAKFQLKPMIVGGIAIALLGLASIALVGVNAVAIHSGRLAWASAHRGITTDAILAGTRMDYGPACLPIDPD